MFHFKAPGRFLPQRSPAHDWGRFEHFIEVADDQHASRSVNVFKCGKIVRYDRTHPRDAFGYLAGLKFSLQPKWRRYYPQAAIITASEFEAVWRTASGEAARACPIGLGVLANFNRRRELHAKSRPAIRRLDQGG
jgi:hypothetical protein